MLGGLKRGCVSGAFLVAGASVLASRGDTLSTPPHVTEACMLECFPPIYQKMLQQSAEIEFEFFGM